MIVKVVSLNLWHGGKLFPGVLDFLRQQAADIVILQEIFNSSNTALESRFHSMEYLRRELNYPHDDFSQVFVYELPEVGKVPQGTAVLARFPITSSDVKIFSDQPLREFYHDQAEDWAVVPRSLQHVELDTPAGSVDVFNLHGVWDLDGDNYSEARKHMTDTILEAVAGKERVILAGDSNAKPTNQAIQRLGPTLKSVFGDSLTSTFNMRRKDNPGYASAAVDIIFVTSNITVVERDCPNIDISDHLPLTATLEISIA